MREAGPASLWRERRAYFLGANVSERLQIRLPAPELIERYRSYGLWPDDTLSQLLDRGLRAHSGQTYRVWSDERPFNGTFADVRERSLRLATGLRRLGVGPGDVVSFQLPNWIECVETFLATIYLGAVSLPVVHIYGAKELKFVLGQTQAKVHVTTDHFRTLDYRSMIDGMKADLPHLEHVLFVEDDFDALRDNDPLEALVDVHPDAPAVLGYTSGTTSDPKGVIHTHRTQVIEMLQRTVREPGDDRPLPVKPPEGYDHWFVGSPIGHVSGLQIGLYVPVLFDRPGHITDRWDVETVLDVLVSANLQIGASANYFFNSVISHPRFDPEVHIPHMRYILSGGAPVPKAFGEKCNEMGIALVRGYGSTEHPSISGAAFEDPLEKRIGTDGRAMAGVEIEIRDDDGNVLPRGVAGHIHTRGPDLFAGYVDMVLNADAFDAEGWFDTGDIGILDEEGFISITDRAKDIIIRGGENISASEVEDVVCRMAEVAEAAAVAAPDERMGERVCVFLRLNAGAEAPTLEDLRRHLAASGLARQKWPEQIRVVDDFDRTPAGKVKKFVLRDALRREAAVVE
jgi:acyl-CoA synthetase (AMP-forming)/AMP-acid ligase II